MKTARALVLVSFAVALSSCQIFSNVRTTITDLQPTIGTSWGSIGLTDPSGAPIGSSQCSASPSPAAPDVNAWWAGLGTTVTATNAVVGFNLWSNTNPGCGVARHDLFRPHVSFSLAPLRAVVTGNLSLQDALASAKLVFNIVENTPLQTSAGITCSRGFSGGAANLLLLRQGTVVTSGLARTLQHPAPVADIVASFPPTTATPIQDLAQLQPSGTTGRATVTAAGPGITRVEVDVRDYMLGALNRGDAAIGFAVSSVGETAMAVSGEPQVNCRTFIGAVVLRASTI